MNINFELYRIFYEVASVGNITKTSKKLMISQPAISKQIKNLEESLGGPLFVRTKKGVHLTENGKEVYKHVQTAITSIQNAEHAFRGLKTLEYGTIRIGISTTLSRYFLLSYLQIFHKKYPYINIEIFTDPTDSMIAKLKNGAIDFILCKIPEMVEQDIAVTILGELHTVFIVGKTFENLTKDEFSLDKLTQYPLVLPKKSAGTRRFIDQFCHNNHVHIQALTEIASASLLTDFVKIGFGIGVATREYIKDELAKKTILELKTKPSLPSTPFGILTMRENILPFSAKKLIEILKGELL